MKQKVKVSIALCLAALSLFTMSGCGEWKQVAKKLNGVWDVISYRKNELTSGSGRYSSLSSTISFSDKTVEYYATVNGVLYTFSSLDCGAIKEDAYGGFNMSAHFVDHSNTSTSNIDWGYLYLFTPNVAYISYISSFDVKDGDAIVLRKQGAPDIDETLVEGSYTYVRSDDHLSNGPSTTFSVTKDEDGNFTYKLGSQVFSSAESSDKYKITNRTTTEVTVTGYNYTTSTEEREDINILQILDVGSNYIVVNHYRYYNTNSSSKNSYTYQNNLYLFSRN